MEKVREEPGQRGCAARYRWEAWPPRALSLGWERHRASSAGRHPGWVPRLGSTGTRRRREGLRGGCGAAGGAHPPTAPGRVRGGRSPLLLGHGKRAAAAAREAAA